jgi:hypothetical protein
VVELDDLRSLEERRRHLGEAHHQHRADGEVRRDQAVARGERRLEGLQVGVVEPGRTDDGVDAVGGEERERGAGGGGDREVDDDLGPGLDEAGELGLDLHTTRPLGSGVVGVDGGHELQVVVGVHGLAHRATHAPAGADDADAQRHGRQSSGGGGGPDAATGGGGALDASASGGGGGGGVAASAAGGGGGGGGGVSASASGSALALAFWSRGPCSASWAWSSATSRST